MEIAVKIEHVFENPTPNGPHLFIQLLNENDSFSLTETLTISGYRIIQFGMPRTLDEKGNPRFDIYSLHLKNKSDLSNFKEGEIVKLLE